MKNATSSRARQCHQPKQKMQKRTQHSGKHLHTKKQAHGASVSPSLQSAERVYPTSQPSSACFQASRLTAAMDSVNGMFLGHACTQFCALAQSWMPPGPIIAARRSLLFMAPVGCILKRRTWLMIAAPTN